MNIPERIMQYLDYKGISKLAFYRSIGVKNGFLDKKETIRADKLAVITEVYPDLNLNWVITGAGQMLMPEGSEYVKEDFDSRVEDAKGEYKTEEKVLKPYEIIGKLVLQNETLIAIIDRHSTIIEKLSSHI